MADVTPIVASVQVDTGSANTNLKDVKKNISEVKGALNEAGAAAKSAGKDVDGASGSFGKLKEQMSALPGPLGAAGEGVGKVNSAFKALLANPIVAFLGLIVAALVLIYKAFTNTFEGGEKVEQVFAGIKAAGQALLDSLEKIGSSIVKIFSFDFSGAIADMRAVGDAAVGAFNKMSALTKQAQELAREQATNDLESVERQRKLAILREQAGDDDVPLAKRKAALKELQKASEENAKEDLDLAKRTAENKIAQLTLEKDGNKKNFVEIQKIKADQLRGEIDNANELRRINKQVTSAEKQELAERKEAAKAASEASKAERQKLADFNNKLSKLQQDNQVALIRDGYEKELAQLKIRIDNEKKINQAAFQDKKVTKTQQVQLDAALDIQLDLQRAAIEEKRQKELTKKEEDFQKELFGIRQKTQVAGLTDARQIEIAALAVGYEEKVQQAIQRYKDDDEKLKEIRAALDEQARGERAKLQDKFDKEDAKKKFDLEEQAQIAIIQKQNFDFEAKFAAVEADQLLVQKAFDDKVISELDYNNKIAALSETRKAIRDAERDHNQAITSAIGNAFGTLSEIAGKQTVLGKALAIAQTTISTYQSAIGAFKGMVTTIPGPVGIALGVVAAAGALATGIAAVKKIVSVQVPGQGGGGGGSAPSGLPAQAAPVAPTTQTTQIDQGSLNQIGNAASRVFILDSDVKNSRDKDERLNRAARLGG